MDNRFIRLADGPQTLPEKSRNGAIWGYTDHPNEYAPEVYETRRDVANGQALYLMEIEASPQDDLFVVNVGVFQNFIEHWVERPSLRDQFAPQYQEKREAYKQATDEIYQAYWDSRIPFFDYAGDYLNAEVVSFAPVPFDRMRIISKSDEFKPQLNISAAL